MSESLITLKLTKKSLKFPITDTSLTSLELHLLDMLPGQD